MTDTATEKRAQKPRDVEYTLEVVDDLPDLEVQRRSPLTDQINKIIDTPASHGKFVRMASYANGSAASAAANVLRKKYGDKETVQGWMFRPRRVDVEIDRDGEKVTEPRTVLFARYTPDAIVDGEQEAFEKRLQDREAKNEERRALRDQVDASTGNSGQKTPRERKQGPGQTSGTASASGAKAPGAA